MYTLYEMIEDFSVRLVYFRYNRNFDFAQIVYGSFGNFDLRACLVRIPYIDCARFVASLRVFVFFCQPNRSLTRYISFFFPL